MWLQSYAPGGVQILVRVAVPFFFCVTGYFWGEAVSCAGGVAIRMAFRKNLRQYVAWSAFYFTVIFVSNPELLTLKSLKWMLADFFVNGSYYHLWYMVAVLWGLAAFARLYRVRRTEVLGGTVALYLLGLLGTSYYALGSKIPGVSVLIQAPYFNAIRRIALMGFPFLMLGWMLFQKRDAILCLSVRKTVCGAAAATLLFVIEIVFVVITGAARSIVITVFLYPLVALLFALCLKWPLPRCAALGAYCRSMAGTVYFLHPFVILLLGKCTDVVGLPLFLLTAVVSTAVAWPVAYLKQKKTRKVEHCDDECQLPPG